MSITALKRFLKDLGYEIFINDIVKSILYVDVHTGCFRNIKASPLIKTLIFKGPHTFLCA